MQRPVATGLRKDQWLRQEVIQKKKEQKKLVSVAGHSTKASQTKTVYVVYFTTNNTQITHDHIN